MNTLCLFFLLMFSPCWASEKEKRVLVSFFVSEGEVENTSLKCVETQLISFETNKTMGGILEVFDGEKLIGRFHYGKETRYIHQIDEKKKILKIVDVAGGKVIKRIDLSKCWTGQRELNESDFLPPESK